MISFKVSKTGKMFNPAPQGSDEELSVPASKNKSDIISLSTRKLGGEDSDTNGRKRVRQIPEVEVGSNNLNGKKACVNRVPENNASASASDNGKRENQDVHLPPLMNKRARLDEKLHQSIRRGIQYPTNNGGGLPQFPLSSKSGEFSSGSHVSSGHVTQKEKWRNQGQTVAKSPIVSQTCMLERFSKIQMVATRFQLNIKKSKIDENHVRNPTNSYTTRDLMTCLSNVSNNDIYIDEPFILSMSLIGGNMNIPKTRVLNFTQTEQGGNTSFQLVTKARTRMILSEKPDNGSVAIHIGEIEDADYLAGEEYLPTLPNTRSADLLAAQLSSLMARQGYNVEDNLQLSNPDMQQPFSRPLSIQPSNTNNNPPHLNSPHNTQHGPPRMLPPGNNNQPIQISQQSEQQQQFQIPPLMLSSNIDNAFQNRLITAEQARLMKLRMQQQYQQQNRLNMLGPARQMNPMNQAIINNQMMQQQRAAIGQMGPSKLMPGGMNAYMNQQQQMQLQMLMQQMQQIQQQQESVFVSPPQVQSPSSMMTYQLQQQQRTPMSPQLSLQTMGSVGEYEQFSDGYVGCE